MFIRRMIIAICWIFLAFGCGPRPAEDSGSIPAPEAETSSETNRLSGVYDYRAEADEGRIVGTLTLEFDRIAREGVPMRVTGSWELASEGLVGEVGPQTGSGQLEGEFHPDGTLRLELNPGMFDNNVTLAGTIRPSGTGFSGSWGYSNFTGLVSTGSFDADKR